MKEYSDEEMLLRADEHIKQAKGYILFTVDQMGQLWVVEDTTKLNQAELCGLHEFRKRNKKEMGDESEF